MKQIGILTAAALTLASAVIVAVVVNRRRQIWDRQMRDGSKAIGQSPYRSIVEEQLAEFEGEDSTMRHAFEDALEAEARLERQLARETGLKA